MKKLKLINLRQFRKERSLTQVELAKVLELPQSTISFLENGRQEVSDYFLECLQKAYGVNNIQEYVYERSYFPDHNHLLLTEKEKMTSIYAGSWEIFTPINIIEGYDIICEIGLICISFEGALIIDRNYGSGKQLSPYIIQPQDLLDPYLLLGLTKKEWFDKEMFDDFKRAYFVACKIIDVKPVTQLKIKPS